MPETLERQIKSISSKLTTLLSETKKEPQTWVKASIITGLTGWDKHKMKSARDNNYIKYLKDAPGKPGFWYLLESLNPFWYKSKDSKCEAENTIKS